MDDTVKLLLSYAIIPIILGIGTFIMKSIHMRLDEIEKVLPSKLNRGDVRQIVSDKIDPIHEDLKDLKDQVDKVIDLLIKKQ